MTLYKYEMYFNDKWNDITPYVETNTSTGLRLDQTLNTAAFTFAHIRADKIEGIDLSKVIKPWIPVKVTIDNDTFRFYTADSNRELIKKTEPRLYKHTIQLIEATRILQRKTLSDITVTQPKSKQFTPLFVSDYKTLNKQTVENTSVYPPVTLIQNSLDTSAVDGNVIKANHDGSVLVTFDVENYQFNRQTSLLDLEALWWPYNYSSAEVELIADVFINDILKESKTFYIPPTTAKLDGKWWYVIRNIKINTPEIYKPSMHVDIPASAVDQAITVKIRTAGSWNWEASVGYSAPSLDKVYEDKLDVITYLSIGAGDGESEAFIYLDELANKCIRSLNNRDVNDVATNDYRLDPTVEADLKGKLSPEFTFTNYKAWDALIKIAMTQNAVPEIKDDFRTITFRYLDDIPDMYYDIDMFDDETQAYSSSEYADGLEVNAPNVVEEDVLLNGKIEPYADGWGSVRTTDELAGQISDDNAVFKTRQPIQKIYKLYVKGPIVKIGTGTELSGQYTNTSILVGNLPGTVIGSGGSLGYWDITDLVVTDGEWNTYPDVTSNTLSSRIGGYKTKGNHLYYVQGSNVIKGLGHKTLTVSDIIGTTVAPRTIMETIATAAEQYLASINSDYEVFRARGASFGAFLPASDPELFLSNGNFKNYDGLLFRIIYVPLTNARATVYKHNAFGNESFLTDFINEQDKLNDTDNLGKYVTTTLNRQGNSQYTVSGRTRSYGSIPKLGFRTYNDLVVSGIDLNMNKNLINYSLQLSKDFINQSDFVGRNSQYRAFEIPSDNIVHRQDKYTQFVVLTKDIDNVSPKGYEIFTLAGRKLWTQNFCEMIGSLLKPISYAKVEVIENKGSVPKSYDMPINIYSLGTTTNIQYQFETNYSAGAQVVPKIVNGINAKMQQYVQYTDTFGQIYSIKSDMYPRGSVNNGKLDADKYPMYDNVPTDQVLLSLEMIVEKDAREHYGVNIEVPFISDDSTKIRTFAGISKYNAMSRPKGDIEIGIALLDNDYFPSVNETVLDMTRVKTLSNIGSSEYNPDNGIFGIAWYNLNIPKELRFNGYVVYEKNTKELIYAVKEDIAPHAYDWIYNSEIVYFVPKKDLKDNTRPVE